MEQLSSIKRYKAVQLFLALYKVQMLRIAAPLFFIVFIYVEGHNKFTHIHLNMTLAEIRNVDPWRVGIIFGFSMLAVSSMLGYDLLISKYFKFKVPLIKLYQYAWTANTFNNFLGFAGFTGAGIRVILYKRQQVPVKKMLAANAMLAPALIAGISVLAWLAMFDVLPVRPMLHAHHWLIPELWGMALYIILFILVQRSRRFAKWMGSKRGPISWKMVSALGAVSFMEWLFAGAVFWLTGFEIVGSMPFRATVGIYAISAIAGLISLSPGGLGSFDLTALIGLQSIGVSAPMAAAILVIFRLFYFVIPWLLGVVFAVNAVIPNRGQVNDWASSVWEDSLNRWQKIWSWPGQFRFIRDLGVAALSILVFSSGGLLLLSASIPGILYRLRFTAHLLTLPVMTLSHQLSIIIGVILLVLARGIRYRVKRAHHLSVFMLLAGAVFTFAKGFDFEEAVFLVFVAFLLWVSKSGFYRTAVPLSFNSFAIMISISVFAVACYWVLGAAMHPATSPFIHHKRVSPFFYKPHEMFVSGIIGIAGAWAFLVTWILLRPKRKIESMPLNRDMRKVEAFFQENHGSLLAHLVFLGDKSLYWALEGKVLIAYARVRDKLIVLGDPIGEPEFIKRAIEEFQFFADRSALATVFYQISPLYLPIYHETGYRFFKLGEEALIDLAAFTLKGKSRTSFRTARNKLSREGYSFEVKEPPYTSGYLEQLRKVSEEWMGDRKEKGFSMGWFSENYLQRSITATMCDANKQVIAFASLMPSYSEDGVISIDLMRHLNQIPNGTMDVLFTRLFDWAKEKGYRYFNMGMAPLSNVGHTTNALREEKMAHLVFQYGNHWYGFEGLHRYKQKFSPRWEPRYLAFGQQVRLPLLMMDLIKLVSRGQKTGNASDFGENKYGRSTKVGIMARKD